MPAVESQTALIHVMSYGADDVEEVTPRGLVDARAYRGRRPVTWLNLNTVADEVALKSLEADFGVHPLTVEDIRNTHQRPKVESYKGYLYVVTRMLARDAEGEVRTEQISMLLGPDWLITVQETAGDVFEPVRDRIRTRGTRLRASGADHLLYALLDAVVDSYFPILEAIGVDAETLEDELLAEPPPRDAKVKLQDLRRQLLTLRRVAWPQRDVLVGLERDETGYVKAEAKQYLRDVNDHATRVIDFVETNREFAANLMELYVSAIAQRTNEVMKVLTIVGTIFIPLTFIVGVYGMNFDRSYPTNMPELGWRYGYVAVMASMAVLALAMLAWFRKRGWI